MNLLTWVRPASVSAQFGSWGDRGGGPVYGGGPLLSLQRTRLPNEFNRVNQPFRLSEMAENSLGGAPSQGRGQAWIKPRRMARVPPSLQHPFAYGEIQSRSRA